MCVWFTLEGAVMCQVSHCKVPSCAKDAHRLVHPCAKLSTSRSHCTPILPIARCHHMPMRPNRMCHHVPREFIAWFTSVQAARLRVPRWPCQGAIVCQVAHLKVALRAQFLIARCHCVASCPHKVPLRAKFPIARCNCLPTLPIARFHRVACCPSQGAIVCKKFYVKVSSCGYVSNCMVP